MDLAASIIAIVEITATISISCFKYARGVNRAAEEAAALHKQMGLLVQVLVRLQQPSMSAEFLKELQPAIETCKEDLLKLQKKLEPAESAKLFQQSLIWPFKKQGEFRNASARIEEHFGIFQKAVAVSTLEIAADIRCACILSNPWYDLKRTGSI